MDQFMHHILEFTASLEIQDLIKVTIPIIIVPKKDSKDSAKSKSRK